MSITRQVDCQGLVNTEIAGHVGIFDILNGLLEHGKLTEQSRQFWEIVILDPHIAIDRDIHATLGMAHRAKEVIQFKSRGAVALVATNEFARNWCEEVATLLRGDTVPVTVFENEPQARRWLSIHMSQARLEATTIRRPRPINVQNVQKVQNVQHGS